MLEALLAMLEGKSLKALNVNGNLFGESGLAQLAGRVGE